MLAYACEAWLLFVIMEFGLPKVSNPCLPVPKLPCIC